MRKNYRKGCIKQDRWPSIQGMLRSGKGDVYTVEKTVKHLSREYEKGTVLPDGRIIPFVLALEGPAISAPKVRIAKQTKKAK